MCMEEWSELRQKDYDDTFFTVDGEFVDAGALNYLEAFLELLNQLRICRSSVCAHAIDDRQWIKTVICHEDEPVDKSVHHNGFRCGEDLGHFRCPKCGHPYSPTDSGKKGWGTLPAQKILLIGHGRFPARLPSGEVLPPGTFIPIPCKWEDAKENVLINKLKEHHNQITKELADGMTRQQWIDTLSLPVALCGDKKFYYNEMDFPQHVKDMVDRENAAHHTHDTRNGK